MVLKRLIRSLKRPGRLLGFLLFGELFLFFLFVFWYACPWVTLKIFNHGPPILKIENWLFLIGIVSAITGWIVSSYITLRNSIKQHTINILLQSRLSATYMDVAKHINSKFFSPTSSRDPVSVDFLNDPVNQKDLEAFVYILNYLEFVAVGVRHGDIDEMVMKDTIRGILCGQFDKAKLFIMYQRGDNGTTVKSPKVFEHLVWLNNKWNSK